MNHNHLTDDYYHQWFIKEERDRLHPLIKASQAIRNFQLPILYFVYLMIGAFSFMDDCGKVQRLKKN